MLKPTAAAWILIKIANGEGRNLAYMVTNMIIFSCYVDGVLKYFSRIEATRSFEWTFTGMSVKW